MIIVFLLEEVLPFVAGAVTVFDGVVRAVMIAVETRQTTAVMLPLRLKAVAADDVVRRTDLGADATTHTTVGINAKGLVGDELMLKDGAEDMTVDPWPVAIVESKDILLTVEDFLTDDAQSLVGPADLLAFFFFRVDIHERQTDITLGHDERPGTVDMRDAELLQTLVGRKDRVEVVFYRPTNIITGSDQREAVRLFGRVVCCGRLSDDHFPEKGPDDCRHAPAVDGEDKTQALVGLKGINTIARECLGDIDETLTGVSSQSSGGPAAVAGSREECDHAYLASFMSPSM